MRPGSLEAELELEIFIQVIYWESTLKRRAVEEAGWDMESQARKERSMNDVRVGPALRRGNWRFGPQVSQELAEL